MKCADISLLYGMLLQRQVQIQSIRNKWSEQEIMEDLDIALVHVNKALWILHGEMREMRAIPDDV